MNPVGFEDSQCVPPCAAKWSEFQRDPTRRGASSRSITPARIGSDTGAIRAGAFKEAAVRSALTRRGGNRPIRVAGAGRHSALPVGTSRRCSLPVLMQAAGACQPGGAGGVPGPIWPGSICLPFSARPLGRAIRSGVRPGKWGGGIARLFRRPAMRPAIGGFRVRPALSGFRGKALRGWPLPCAMAPTARRPAPAPGPARALPGAGLRMKAGVVMGDGSMIYKRDVVSCFLSPRPRIAHRLL